MRLACAALLAAIALTMAGLAFAVAVCLTTAGIVWAVHAVIGALPEPSPSVGNGPVRSP